MIEQPPDAMPEAGDGRGDFFAVDRRPWHFVCTLGMNASIAYLIAARGTGGDNRTTKWSVKAIERRTGISRSRAEEAIRRLERSGPNHPKYKLLAAHEIKGCEGYPPAPLDAERAKMHAALGEGWVEVPKEVSGRNAAEFKRWGSWFPKQTVERLANSGHARAHENGRHFMAIRYDAEVSARPDWMWLPNALIDGADGEIPPVELVRQTGEAASLRLLVNLYGSQVLDEDGGIHFRRLRKSYERHKVGEWGQFVVWGFVPGKPTTWRDTPFVAVHLAEARDAASQDAGMQQFWNSLSALQDLGLVEFVAHLVDADTVEGEIIHPVALSGTGSIVERQLGQAAMAAGRSLVTEGQIDWATAQGVVMLAPVLRHIAGVQMFGVARLRYRPRTARTLAFMARERDWHEVLVRLQEINLGHLATSRYNQGSIKG